MQAGDNPISAPAEIFTRKANTDAVGVVKSLTEFAIGKTLANNDGMTQSSNDAVCAAFAGSLPRTNGTVQSQYLLMNPLGFVRQIGVDLSKFLPASSGMGRGVIEVPPFGFTFFTADDLAASRQNTERSEPIVQGENMLVNEFCEVTIHPETGGIRSIRDFHSRQMQTPAGDPAAITATRNSSLEFAADGRFHRQRRRCALFHHCHRFNSNRAQRCAVWKNHQQSSVARCARKTACTAFAISFAVARQPRDCAGN